MHRIHTESTGVQRCSIDSWRGGGGCVSDWILWPVCMLLRRPGQPCSSHLRRLPSGHLPASGQCWASVADAGPTLPRYLGSVSLLLERGYHFKACMSPQCRQYTPLGRFAKCKIGTPLDAEITRCRLTRGPPPFTTRPSPRTTGELTL